MSRAAFVAVVLVTLVASTSPRAESQNRPGAGTPRTQTAATAFIVGQVIDAHTGRGVAGAIVSLTGGPGSRAATPGSPLSPNPGSLNEQLRGVDRVMATTDGRFVFRDLAPGSYNVTAQKPGYIDGAYGRRMPTGATRSLVLAEGERVGDVSIAIWKYAAISGTVIDEAGEPVVGIQVRAMRRSIVAGRRLFTTGASGTTDDRGVFRISMLTPGDYLVAVVSTHVAVPLSTLEELRGGGSQDPTRTLALRSLFEAGSSTASPGSATAVQVGDLVQTVRGSHVPPPPGANAAMFVYPTMFFPASGSSSDAGLVSVASGEEHAGADFQMKPVPATQISGKVLSAEGPVQNITIRLVNAESEDFATELDVATTVSAGDGSFVFPAVPAGAYVLDVQRYPRPIGPGSTTTIVQSGSGMTISAVRAFGARVEVQMSSEPVLWARVPITVDTRPVSDISISLQTAARVGGRIVFEGTTTPPKGDQLTSISVVADAPDGRSRRMPSARVDRFGRFTIPGLPGGRYFLRGGGAPEGWTFKSAMLEGRDISEVPLEVGAVDISAIAITFTDRPTQLTGMVRNDQGAPDPDATVLVFPSDAQMWTGHGHGLLNRRFRSVRAGTTGAYTVLGLPAGSYAVIAVPDEQTADWQDPINLETLARRAARVQIDDDQTRSQNLITGR